MIVYANSAFREMRADKMKAMENARNRRISSANLVYALMNVTGTKYPLYDATLDFFRLNLQCDSVLSMKRPGRKTA